MLRWSEWRKPALVLAVCALHLAFLAGFSCSFALGKSVKAPRLSSNNISVTFRPAINKPYVDAVTKIKGQASKASNEATDVSNAAKNQKSSLPETPFKTGLQSTDRFLDSDEVDITAEADDNFETLLAQLLPLNIQSVVLEFWIEKDGRTVEVRCIEGICTDEVKASLPKLGELTFTPALKNGKAVANRKVIQIDIKPSFDM